MCWRTEKVPHVSFSAVSSALIVERPPPVPHIRIGRDHVEFSRNAVGVAVATSGYSDQMVTLVGCVVFSLPSENGIFIKMEATKVRVHQLEVMRI